ncbi:hypothetical protein AiwAL_19395 [Acidiphilium sp. AL]|uniref:hypothetical protein n=1 Tax=Acidiphilium sp. AL TaxID=2871704 RepID=UPI0021CB4839|nr:hypothetical protein [Acidiphilium sp. AL]MCU4162214.1 hypothetical protein [Acidiphilium sp. AL]
MTYAKDRAKCFVHSLSCVAVDLETHLQSPWHPPRKKDHLGSFLLSNLPPFHREHILHVRVSAPISSGLTNRRSNQRHQINSSIWFKNQVERRGLPYIEPKKNAVSVF